MDVQNKQPSATRRGLLQGAAVTLAAVASGRPAYADKPAGPGGEPAAVQLRDRFWLWTHAEGAYGDEYALPRRSRMTPVEGATYLDVPNIMFIRYSGKPALPFDQYAISFRPLKRVVWSLVGASGQSGDEERKHVLELAARFPNISGFIMDDYFHADGSGSLSNEQLKELRAQLDAGGRKRDLYVVLYQHQLGLPIQAQLELCDKITFWTWEAKDLVNLESAFDRLEKLAPRHGKLLGCYMWDFGASKPMPLDAMKRQCELGLQWLKAGRIEGMIFLASNICDLELETVEWSRRWIAEVGRTAIKG